jgi:hypothetical protein
LTGVQFSIASDAAQKGAMLHCKLINKRFSLDINDLELVAGKVQSLIAGLSTMLTDDPGP